MGQDARISSPLQKGDNSGLPLNSQLPGEIIDIQPDMLLHHPVLQLLGMFPNIGQALLRMGKGPVNRGPDRLLKGGYPLPPQ
jgi:hypothetical protein